MIHSLSTFNACSAVAIFALLSTSILAQEVDEDAGEAVDQVQDQPGLNLELDREAIEEIIVVAPKPGSRRRLDLVYEDPLRARLLKEQYEMALIEEESAWRSAAVDDSSSRIKWGYDPTDDYRTHSETAIMDTPSSSVKPASVFRVEF